MRVVHPEVIVGMKVSTQLGVRSGVLVHFLAPLLLAVALGVGVAASRMKKLHCYFFRKDKVVRVLTEIHDIVAWLHLLSFVLEPVGDERETVNLRAIEGIVMRIVTRLSAEPVISAGFCMFPCRADYIFSRLTVLRIVVEVSSIAF